MPKTKKPMYLNIPMSLHEEYRQKHFPNLTDFMTRSSMFRGAKITLTHGSLQNIAGNISNFCSKKKQKKTCPKLTFLQLYIILTVFGFLEITKKYT